MQFTVCLTTRCYPCRVGDIIAGVKSTDVSPWSTLFYSADADSCDVRRDVGDIIHRPLQLCNALLDLVGMLVAMHCIRKLSIMQGTVS